MSASNEDLMRGLGRIDSKLDTLRGLVQDNRGDINTLLEWKKTEDIIAQYKKDNPTKQVTINNKPFYLTDGGQKIALGVGAVLAAIGAVIALQGGVS